MNSTAFADRMRDMLIGFVIAGILCDAVFAAPPEVEKEDFQPEVSNADSERAASDTKSSRPVRKSGESSLLGSVIRLFTRNAGAETSTSTVAVDIDGEGAESTADNAVPPAIRREVEAAEPWNLPAATHRQQKTVNIAKKGTQGLQTFCVTANGNLVAVVGPPRYGAGNARGKTPNSELHVFDGDGSPLRDWTVDFVVQAVSACPDGSILAAGSGQVAKFTSEGELVKQAELQHVKEALGDPEAMRTAAEELLEQQREQIEGMFKDQMDGLQRRINNLKAEIEDADADDKRTKTKTRQLAAAERSLSQIKKQQDQMGGEQKIEDVILNLTSRLKIVNAITSTQDEVFVACGVKNGYGYAVWRMTWDLEEPKQIITGLSGCCGQMDIQCRGSELYVAENSRHRVVCYDRDGKLLRSFGGRMGQKNGEFGGCCNPMNLCFDQDGSVLTAESEGIVRKFTSAGKSLGPVGGCKLSGGCKNVAIGISPDGEKVYFCDLPGSRIIVMGRDAGESDEVQETSAKK